jgi:membrane protein implicated in regulation of membrane protease activity
MHGECQNPPMSWISPDDDMRRLQMLSMGRVLLVLALIIPGLFVATWQVWAFVGLAVVALVLWEVHHRRGVRARRSRSN